MFKQSKQNVLAVYTEVRAVNIVGPQKGSRLWLRRLNILQNDIWVLSKPFSNTIRSLKNISTHFCSLKNIDFYVVGSVKVVEATKWVEMLFQRQFVLILFLEKALQNTQISFCKQFNPVNPLCSPQYLPLQPLHIQPKHVFSAYKSKMGFFFLKL